MKAKAKGFAIGVYIAIVIFTFGHYGASSDAYRDKNCVTLEQRANSLGSKCYGTVFPEAVFAAVVWPLYWSWELQS